MIVVILKDGYVLKYNNANNSLIRGNVFVLESTKGHWVAQIPMDAVARIEAYKPCRILKEKRDRKKMRTY